MHSVCIYALLHIRDLLHLNDSDQQVSHGQPGYDALFKVRKLLDLITPRLMSEYHVHEELAVDEAMIPFKGRLDCRLEKWLCQA